MAWRGPPPSSRLAERHLCLTGPDPPTASTIILRAHGSKFSERCRSFFRSKPDARIQFDLAKRPHALERPITRNTAAFLVEGLLMLPGLCALGVFWWICPQDPPGAGDGQTHTVPPW